jgi:hypothetical protein
LFEASFDVYREDKRRYYWAVVEDVDFTEQAKRIYFRFKKSKDNHVEWIEFGSPRICTHKSKTAKKDPKQDRNGDETDKTVVLVNRNTTIDIEVNPGPNEMGVWNKGNTTKAPQSNNEDEDDNDMVEKNTIGYVPSSNILDVGTNSQVSRSYDPFSNHDTTPVVELSVPAHHRLPDFITPPNVSSFTLDKKRLPIHQQQQHITDGLAINEPTISPEAVVSQFPVSASKPTSYRSSGSIPAGWSGLDILAAVTFDASTTSTAKPMSSMDPTLSSANMVHSIGQLQASYSWGGDSSIGRSTSSISNYADNVIGNVKHHAPTWQNQQMMMPMWPHQQAQVSEQQWFPPLNNMSIFPTAPTNSNYNRMNQNFLPKQPQTLTLQQWQSAPAATTSINHNNGSSNDE